MVATAPTLSTNLCWLLSRAGYALTTELTAALEELDVSPRAQNVLGTAMCGEYTQTELANLVGLDKTTMVATMDELEAKGLAERRPSPSDRRARVIGVTDAGKRKVRASEEIVARVHADVLSSLPARDRKVFLDALTTLATERLAEPVECAHAPRRRAPR
jgi:MarR family transcriptional regulator for hemolysin